VQANKIQQATQNSTFYFAKRSMGFYRLRSSLHSNPTVWIYMQKHHCKRMLAVDISSKFHALDTMPILTPRPPPVRGNATMLFAGSAFKAAFNYLFSPHPLPKHE